MVACKNGISLLVFNSSYRVKHSNRNSISTCAHVLFSMYRSSTGHVAVKYRLCSVKYRSSVGQVSVKCRSSVGQVSVKYRSCIGEVTVMYRSSIDGLRLYRSTVGRYIG